MLNTDQYSYMYELQPGNEEEVSVIEQIAKIAQDVENISQLTIQQLLDGSYLVLKWSPTNNNSSFKI